MSTNEDFFKWCRLTEDMAFDKYGKVCAEGVEWCKDQFRKTATYIGILDTNIISQLLDMEIPMVVNAAVDICYGEEN